MRCTSTVKRCENEGRYTAGGQLLCGLCCLHARYAKRVSGVDGPPHKSDLTDDLRLAIELDSVVVVVQRLQEKLVREQSTATSTLARDLLLLITRGER